MTTQFNFEGIDVVEHYGDIKVYVEGRIIDITYEDDYELKDLLWLENINLDEFRYPADLATRVLHTVLASARNEASIAQIKLDLCCHFEDYHEARAAAENYLNGQCNIDWPMLEQAIDRAGEVWCIESYLEKLPQQDGWKLTRVGRMLAEMLFGTARVKSID